jgi:hypothetical protein
MPATHQAMPSANNHYLHEARAPRVARLAGCATLSLVLLQPGCAPLQNRDPLGVSLQRHLNQPVMSMVRRFGTPVQERGQSNERWYVWSSPACTVSARVDGRELVIDAYWNGNRESCAKLLEDTALL